MDNYNCKTQAHVRVCEEKLELKEKMTPIEINCDKRCEFEGSYIKSGETYKDDILKDLSPYHKGISTILS